MFQPESCLEIVGCSKKTIVTVRSFPINSEEMVNGDKSETTRKSVNKTIISSLNQYPTKKTEIFNDFSLQRSVKFYKKFLVLFILKGWPDSSKLK